MLRFTEEAQTTVLVLTGYILSRGYDPVIEEALTGTVCVQAEVC